MDFNCYLFFVFTLLSCLFHAALSLTIGKGLTFWLLAVDNVFLCFSHFSIRFPKSGVVLDCIDF